ncbi:MAG: hypothetical protein QM579_03190 [Desulfovibrio sp.]|uniref:hypothetical protein n=1 Tax=Desulfovibrio sp. TaxID=885 RepID=UPI0039E657C6
MIELLYKAGKQSACEAQVKKLSRMFSAYSGFWQAWAASLASENQGADTAAVMRFLALNFAKGPVSLCDVLEQGVSSLLGHGTAQVGQVNVRAVLEQEPTGAQLSHEDFSINEATSPIKAQPTSEKGMIAQPSDLQDFTQPVDVPAQPLESSDISALSADQNADNSGAREYLLHDSMQDDALPHQALNEFDPEDIADEEAALPKSSIQATDAASSSAEVYEPEHAALSEDEPSDSEVAAENLPNSIGDETEEGEERFSLRTRSMAEVLAEQGDIKGALDIYHELAAAATAPEENADLRQRIATLNARLGSTQPVEQTLETAESGASTGKDKLISMLEALAERVEARAHS